MECSSVTRCLFGDFVKKKMVLIYLGSSLLINQQTFHEFFLSTLSSNDQKKGYSLKT